jgi:hypothetical protein
MNWTRAEWGLSSETLTGGAWHPASNSLLLRAGSTRRLYLDRVAGEGTGHLSTQKESTNF